MMRAVGLYIANCSHLFLFSSFCVWCPTCMVRDVLGAKPRGLLGLELDCWWLFHSFGEEEWTWFFFSSKQTKVESGQICLLKSSPTAAWESQISIDSIIVDATCNMQHRQGSVQHGLSCSWRLKHCIFTAQHYFLFHSSLRRPILFFPPSKIDQLLSVLCLGANMMRGRNLCCRFPRSNVVILLSIGRSTCVAKPKKAWWWCRYWLSSKKM